MEQNELNEKEDREVLLGRKIGSGEVRREERVKAQEEELFIQP